MKGRNREPQERNGVRVGMPVRDLDGKVLGKVTRLYEDGFHVLGGLPILFRRDLVARYDEVRATRDGDLVLARSDRDFLELGAGGVPAAWRVRTPPEYPSYATPGEAQHVFEDLAAGTLVPDPSRTAARRTTPALPAEPPEPPPAAARAERRREDLAAPPPYP